MTRAIDLPFDFLSFPLALSPFDFVADATGPVFRSAGSFSHSFASLSGRWAARAEPGPEQLLDPDTLVLVDGTTPAGVATLIATLEATNPATGLNGIDLTSLAYAGGAGATSVFDSLILRSGGPNPVSFGNGVLITSGDGAPPRTNLDSAFGEDLFLPGDAEMTQFALDAFPAAGETFDATILTLTINVTDANVRSVRFDVAFGSDEYPEFSDTEYVDIAAISINGVNYALIDNNPLTPLSVVQDNLNLGNFINNEDGFALIEYDGIINLQSIYVPVVFGVNTIRIGVADTGDGIYDSGLFILDMAGSNLTSGGTFQVIVGSEAGETLTGGASNEQLIGLGGPDILLGNGGDDILEGGGGSDRLEGGAGDDWFVRDSSAGLDQMFGGAEGADAGVDTVDFAAAAAGVNVQLVGYATIAGIQVASLSGVENAVGSNFADALIGNASANRLTGGAGADWLVGAAGDDWFVQGIEAGPADRLFGDAGLDTIDYGASGAGIVVQLAGYSTINGGALLATFTGIENATGSAFNDVLIGDGANNRIAGGAGADWLVGAAGADTFVQNIQSGAPDRLFGDSGLDTIDYSAASGGVTVQLSGYSTVNGGALLATFAGIENATGSAFADVLIGDGGANRIAGGAGSDWLVGGGGDDAFVQGVDAGSLDRLFGDAGIDTLDYSGGGAGGVTVQLSGYATTGAGAVLATFSGFENAIGTSSNDALVGTGANNRLTGGAGADWLVGGAGADAFVYPALGAGADTVADFSRAQNDRIDLSAIDTDPLQIGDQFFQFSTTRTAGVAGQAVVTETSATSATVRLYLDADNVADQVINVIHESGVAMNASDFVL